MEYETLDGQQVKKAIKGEELNISIRDHKPPSIKKDDSDEEETLPLGAQIATETND